MRSCSDCNACCVVSAIAEFGKPMYVPCKHLCKNCTIYEQRPKECRDYNCLWLLGQIPGEDRRPDKIGLVFDLGDDVDNMLTLRIHETRENALAEYGLSRLRYLLGKLTHLGFKRVVVFKYGHGVPTTFATGPDYKSPFPEEYNCEDSYVWYESDGQFMRPKAAYNSGKIPLPLV